VISSDDPGAVQTTQRLHGARVITFGQASGADVRVHSVVSGSTVSFVLGYLGNDYPATLTVPGLHNALNAAGAFGVLVGLGYPPGEALAAIAGFEGTRRRFEFKGQVRGVRVYDDFAHHPTEIAAALTAARGVVGAGRLLPIFQPHLYSRTRLLAGNFARTFEALADHTTVVPIYGARQDPEPGVTGQLITERFEDAGRARYLADWQEAARHAASVARDGDIVITMGGGDIYRIVPDVLRALEERGRGQRD
jgi:UDP-N-acetylmuramate--alanine ligase